MLATAVTVLLITLVSGWVYIKWRHNYWQRRGVTQMHTQPFKKSLAQITSDRYKKAKENNLKFIGTYIFNAPILVAIDPVLIKQIMQKDFPHFLGHGMYHRPEDILTMNLFNLEGDPWRKLRVKLTPTFTSGKMKMMFETLVSKTGGLEDNVAEYADSGKICGIKDILGRFTTDIIGTCAFGIECNSLKDPDNDFRKYGKKIFTSNPSRFWKIFIVPHWLLAKTGFKSNGQDVTDFFTKIVTETIKYRETNNVSRKDFMNLLLQMKNNEDSITDDEIIAQCFIFFLAGFETSSTTMTFALLELAQNQDIQQKLREEIEKVLEKHDGKITYDAVAEMKYLDLVIDETLRKFPPVPVIPRVCSKDYQIPGTDVVIEKGVRVQIPVWGLHKDPDYYPNPEVFNPENFSEENKAKRPDFTFLPFGEGPRMCIGMRFGLMQTKVGLISLVRKFNFTLNDKTKMPIEMERASVVLSAKGDIWLDVTRV
ncbi:probable cytochrome P450 6a17 isoform X2 [Sitophilus oryzae]|uniref:Probable cytochrome P450 6a17 isoform X2 n=1 Tax=Sitophilus oryzae TaxID=7048 RepID=A0A6J2X3S2_SITOR|nr:probable cytochrome P450 6a17 isoform X2 [Sitophilus oryzae]